MVDTVYVIMCVILGFATVFLKKSGLDDSLLLYPCFYEIVIMKLPLCVTSFIIFVLMTHSSLYW